MTHVTRQMKTVGGPGNPGGAGPVSGMRGIDPMSGMMRMARIAMTGIVALILLYLIVPTLIVLPLSFNAESYLTFPPHHWSFKWYVEMADDPAWRGAAFNSFAIGMASALASMVLGTLAALAVVKGRLARGALISALIVAPMMLPHVILAIGLYPVMLDLGLLRGYLAVVIGHTMIGIPLVFITVSAALTGYSDTLELVAMTLGANGWQTFWKVTFPMIRVGVAIGGILAFATSFDELLLALFLTGINTRTLPRLIWQQLNDFLTPSIAVIASLIFVFTLVMLAAASALRKRAGLDVEGAHG
ncbi:ABC transporter permease [Paraburkholderia susongensis]|uniref:Putative spermidine/putrescine transport system permease protein/mannopine transport system permease protein n=1 Tax=Paraburkholderia susongensis TaxID=1515439 RepID=A0A1X7JEE3_9BURK|nr:ABC transporter permease [Paraburkholderia susongensis]SMG26343.1 putative spermidine/putrescine transport system permease protein/mannopine transport system permease protein [Paraburkholderia susongensis]